MLVVISYDVSDDARRSRVSAALADLGTRVQDSVFEIRVDAGRVPAEVARVEAFMNPEQDSLRVYRLCSRCAGAVERHGSPLAEAHGEGPIVV